MRENEKRREEKEKKKRSARKAKVWKSCMELCMDLYKLVWKNPIRNILDGYR